MVAVGSMLVLQYGQVLPLQKCGTDGSTEGTNLGVVRPEVGHTGNMTETQAMSIPQKLGRADPMFAPHKSDPWGYQLSPALQLNNPNGV